MRSEALTLGETTAELIATEVAARTRVRLVHAFGEARTVQEWAELAGVRPDTMRKRLARGYPPEVAIALPGHVRHVDGQALPGGPNSWTWELLDFESDEWARRFIRSHPSGASLERVGAVWGLTKEQIRHIEVRALQKLAETVGTHGDAFLVRWFKERAGEQDAQEAP